MKKPSLSLSVALFVITTGTGFSQSGEPANPFQRRDERGRTVHVLPTPESVRIQGDTQSLHAPQHTGATVYRASYGRGNLIDHGGPEISSAGFYAVYWNNTVALSTATSLGYGSLMDQIGAFVTNFASGKNYSQASTDDYEIVQQYGSHASIANTLPYRGVYIGNGASQTSISDPQIQSWLASIFSSGAITPDSHTLYGTFYPAGMVVSIGSSQSCSSFCGYHSVFTYNGIQVKYAVFPYPNCSGCMLSGKAIADMLTIVGSHEIREAVTDPGDNGTNAWYDRLGYEADDKCAWHNLYQMKSGGFWVQPEYSNGGTITASGFTATYPGPGCVVPF